MVRGSMSTGIPGSVRRALMILSLGTWSYSAWLARQAAYQFEVLGSFVSEQVYGIQRM